MLAYILHSSILLSAAFTFYWLLLRKETFYTINRFFLCTIIILSLLMPLVSIPASWSIRDDIFKKSRVEISSAEPLKDLSHKHNKSSAEKNPSMDSGVLAELKPESWYSTLDLPYLVSILYLTGVVVFLLTFIIQFVIIVLTRFKLKYIQDEQFRIYEMTSDSPPFSFLKWIFINPELYDFDTFSQILDHEKIHVRQAHYLDKMMAEFAVMILWFNPFAWLLRREISNNLEFLTDDTMLNIGTEKESYQMNLLKVSVPQHALSLTTNYNQSILKTRIIMMNAKKSSARSSWKYLSIVPLFGLSFITLNAIDEKEITVQTDQQDKVDHLMNDMSLNDHLEKEPIEPTKTTLNSNIKEDDELNRTRDKKRDNLEPRKLNQSVEKFTQVGFMHDKTKLKPGFWQASIEGDEICFFLNNSRSNRGTWTINECFKTSELINFSKEGKTNFKIKRDAGILNLEGDFKDDYGFGKFTFEPDLTFVALLKNNDIENVDDDMLFQLFISNTTASFVNVLKKNGNQVNGKDLLAAAIHIGHEQRLQELNKIFELTEDPFRYQDALNMAIHGVSLEYSKLIKSLSPTGLSIKRLIDCKIHGVDERYVEDLAAFNFEDLSLKDMIDLKIHNVDIKEMKKLENNGFGKMSVKEMVNLKIHGVNKGFVDAMKNLGYDKLTTKELKDFAIHGVDKYHIEGMKNAGFTQLTPKELIKSKIHDLNPIFVKEMADSGFQNMTFEELLDFSIHNITLRYIEEIKNEGFHDLTPSELVKYKIHGITGKYIRDLKALELKGMTLDNIRKAKIHGVSAEYIKMTRKNGYFMPHINDYKKLKIHGQG